MTICDSPLDWKWSSYRATVALEEPVLFLSPAWVLAAIDERPEVARRQLRWMVEGVDPFMRAASVAELAQRRQAKDNFRG